MSPVCILTLDGELDLNNMINLRNRMSDRLSTGVDCFIVDMQGLKHIGVQAFPLLNERRKNTEVV